MKIEEVRSSFALPLRMTFSAASVGSDIAPTELLPIFRFWKNWVFGANFGPILGFKKSKLISSISPIEWHHSQIDQMKIGEARAKKPICQWESVLLLSAAYDGRREKKRDWLREAFGLSLSASHQQSSCNRSNDIRLFDPCKSKFSITLRNLQIQQFCRFPNQLWLHPFLWSSL